MHTNFFSVFAKKIYRRKLLGIVKKNGWDNSRTTDG
jgi:hypothetical protein